jgi:hypothetical protein
MKLILLNRQNIGSWGDFPCSNLTKERRQQVKKNGTPTEELYVAWLFHVASHTKTILQVAKQP